MASFNVESLYFRAFEDIREQKKERLPVLYGNLSSVARPRIELGTS